MDKIGIIGLGLIGGSLAKAIKHYVGDCEITAFDSDEKALKQAFEEKIIDSYDNDITQKFAQCNIVFVCTPVASIESYIVKLMPIINKGCIITDVGSTKEPLYEKMLGFADKITFIGGHPMAGSERSGYDASKEFLFECAYYIMTPLPNVPKEKINYLENIILKIHAIPIILQAHLHDEVVGAISHVPHIIASGLVNTIKKLDSGTRPYYNQLASGGFKDITRIASSSPKMWHDISFENRAQILTILKAFQDEINCFEQSLLSDNEQGIYDFYNGAKQYRDGLLAQKPFSHIYDIKVDIMDKPGSIAGVSTIFGLNDINIKNIGIINNREFENGILQVVLENESGREKGIKLLQAVGFTVYQQ